MILLCGGKSSRMGEPKGLLSFAGETWLERQLIQFATYGKQAVVVLGHDFGSYFQALHFLKKAEEHSYNWNGMKLSVAVNTNPELGPFSSLQTGLGKLRTNVGVFILPIDVPAPEPEVWKRLQLEGDTRHLDACIPLFAKQHGHPAWLSHNFVLSLRKLSPESSQARLDYQIHALPSSRKDYIPVRDSRVAMNMNTLADFDQLKKSEGFL